MNNFIPKFIVEKYESKESNGRFDAYVIFVDLSGFTAITRKLMQLGNEGAERLSVILNQVFEPMVEVVYQRGGFIPYYAGDAFAGIFFEGSIKIEQLLDTARRLQEMSNRSYHNFDVASKIGISYGMIDWGIIGNRRKSFYFKGVAIDFSAQAQYYAHGGEIVVHDSMLRFFGKLPIIVEPSYKNEYWLWKDFDNLVVDLPKGKVALTPIDEKVIKNFITSPVIKFNSQGEFRSVVSIFISFTGIDIHDELNKFGTIVLDQAHQYGGYFKEVDYGDKGGVMVVLFGAPVAYENNIDRALQFALSLEKLSLDHQTENRLKYKIGITSGLAYTGIIGSPYLKQYAAAGSKVNLAARLMSFSDWGEVLVDEDIFKNKNYLYKKRGEIHYKGFDQLISTYSLEGSKLHYQSTYKNKFIGHDDITQKCLISLEKTFKKSTPSVHYLYGEAGVGKSRFANELISRLSKKFDFVTLRCPADQILSRAFNPFITLLNDYFNQSPELTHEENKIRFEAIFKKVIIPKPIDLKPADPQLLTELKRLKPVLMAVLGIKDLTTIFWKSLDAKARHNNLFDALTVFISVLAYKTNVILLLEDGSFYDRYAINFLNRLVPKIKGLPILFIIPSRYFDDFTRPQLINPKIARESNLPIQELEIPNLNRDHVAEFVFDKFRNNVSQGLLDSLMKSTNGNPFYLEQLLDHYSDNNLLIFKNKKFYLKENQTTLSDHINTILTSRVDQLTPNLREVVKTASVIGSEFDMQVLTEVLNHSDYYEPSNEYTFEHIKESLATEERNQILQYHSGQRFSFRHNLLRQAAYEMQLSTRLKTLHQYTGQAIEKIYSKEIEKHYDDLAYHYNQAQINEKSTYYLEKAARFAFENYQNDQAIYYYDQLISSYREFGDDKNLFHILNLKAHALEVIGDWPTGETTYKESLEVAKKINSQKLLGRVYHRYGHLLMLRGDYEKSLKYLTKSIQILKQLKEKKDLTRAYGCLGNLGLRQGNYNDAITFFKKSMEFSQSLPYQPSQALIVANLGLTLMNLGRYQEGIKWQEEHLELAVSNNDKQGMATLYTNIGIILIENEELNRALNNLKKGLKLCDELGNKQLKSIAIGSIGRIHGRIGEYKLAHKFFEEDLTLATELGDKQGISIAIGLMGELFVELGEFEKAQKYLCKNLEITLKLGYKKGQTKALLALGDLYFYEGNYHKAVQSYDEAGKMAEKISAQFLLIHTKTKLAKAAIFAHKLDLATMAINQARSYAVLVNQNNQFFNIELTEAKLLIAKKNYEKAELILFKLINYDIQPQQQAELNYTLYQATQKEQYKVEAIKNYTSIYANTPKFFVKQRLMELKNA